MKNVIFFGFNSFRKHKRGVENVIEFQSESVDFGLSFYIYKSAHKTEVYKYKNFICIGIGGKIFWPLVLNNVLLRINKKYRPLIHSHTPLFSFFSILKTDILTVHDALYYQASSVGKRFLSIFSLIERCAYRKSRLVHFISKYAKEQSLFEGSNYQIVPNTTRFKDGTNIESLVDGRKKVIFSVRSFEERARFDLLFDVASQFKVDQIQFVVAGKGPLLEFYKNQKDKLGLDNITILGYVSDDEVEVWYRKCDLVMVIAEYGEGFGLPIIEGYYFNKPVIASNRCAIPEVIISPEYLFENTVDSVGQCIKYALGEKEKDFRYFYDQKFSRKIISDQIAQFYRF